MSICPGEITLLVEKIFKMKKKKLKTKFGIIKIISNSFGVIHPDINRMSGFQAPPCAATSNACHEKQ
jgi:hypothetical protein